MTGRATLRRLLTVLVSEWGYDEVVRSLESIRHDGAGSLSAVDSRPKAGGVEKVKRPYVRPSALDVVRKLDLAESRKSLLMELADQFDKKRFLPGIGDVRDFLEMRGTTAAGLTQRAEAFRRILNALLTTSDDRLQEMVRDALHSGPSQLGPLSDAIRAARTAVRSTSESAEGGAVDSGNQATEGNPSSSSYQIEGRKE